jgi:hypothetical protein
MTPKFKLVTFGDGSHGWKLAANRLAREALQSGFFESVDVYNLHDVLAGRSHVPKHEYFRDTRGFGYWSWKSLAVAKALEELPPNFDGIAYVDAGCTLNSNADSNDRMKTYFELALDKGGLAFQLAGLKESNWSKQDLGLELNAIETDGWNSDQLAGGITFWKSGHSSIALSSRWAELSFIQNMHLIDDSPSSKSESKDFIEHRHDQSIFSLLAKQSMQFAILQNETEWGPDWLNSGYSYPIWATRHRSGLDYKLNQINKNRVWLRRVETAKILARDFMAGQGR